MFYYFLNLLLGSHPQQFPQSPLSSLEDAVRIFCISQVTLQNQNKDGSLQTFWSGTSHVETMTTGLSNKKYIE